MSYATLLYATYITRRWSPDPLRHAAERQRPTRTRTTISAVCGAQVAPEPVDADGFDISHPRVCPACRKRFEFPNRIAYQHTPEEGEE